MLINTSEAGTGKTYPTLLHLSTMLGNKVIIAPAFLLRNWKEEATKFSISLDGMLFFSHYQVRQGVLPKHATALVIDECHLAFSNLKGKTLKHLTDWLNKANPPYRYLLSGTPMKNDVGELYPLLRIVGAKEYNNYWRWIDEFAKVEPIYPGATTKKIVGIKNPAGLRAYLQSYTWGVKSKDVIRLDPLTTQRIYVDVPATLDKQLKEFLTEEELELAGSRGRGVQVKRALAIAKASALCKGDNVFHTLETTAPLLVFTDHPSSIIILKDYLSTDRRVGVIASEVPSDERQAICKMFQDGHLDSLVCSIPCSGVGLNLQRAQYIVFCDLSWSASANEQALARAYRKGRTNPLTVYYVVGGEHDEHLAELLTKKQENFLEVFG